MDALGLQSAPARHRRLQVDQSQIRLALAQRLQRHAPDIAERHRAWHRPVAPFRQLHIVAGILDPGLVKLGLARMRQDLVDAAGQHQVAAQKQADCA
ncbi:hypothetical protein D3C77_591310 [compost metagenome]